MIFFTKVMLFFKKIFFYQINLKLVMLVAKMNIFLTFDSINIIFKIVMLIAKNEYFKVILIIKINIVVSF